MTKSFFKTVAAIVVIALVCSCSQTKTNRELFEDTLQKNIEVGMQPLIDRGVDSTAARNCIACVLETMYQIDSTYFLKDLGEIKEIYDKNEGKLQKCMEFLPPKDSLHFVLPTIFGH